MEGGVSFLVSDQAQSGYLLAGLNTVGGVKNLEISIDLTHPEIEDWIQNNLAIPVYQAPRALALITTPKSPCAGVFVGVHTVFVRADCVSDFDVDSISVSLGVRDPSAKEEKTRQNFRVRESVVFPEYNRDTLQNNLAALILEGDAKPDDFVRGASLSTADPLDGGSPVTSLTWISILGKEQSLQSSISTYSTAAWDSSWDGNPYLRTDREFVVDGGKSSGFQSGMNAISFSNDGYRVLGLGFSDPADSAIERNVRLGDYEKWINEILKK
jgi:hypothetical protein